MVRPEQYQEAADDGTGICYTYTENDRVRQIIGPDGKVLRENHYDRMGYLESMTEGEDVYTEKNGDLIGVFKNAGLTFLGYLGVRTGVAGVRTGVNNMCIGASSLLNSAGVGNKGENATVVKGNDGAGSKGGSGAGKLGETFGKMGEYVKNPGTKVDWSQYAEHGYERLAERGMSKELVNSIVRNGKALSQNGGSKFAFVTEEGVAVVSKEGKLITAWSNKYYDEAMKEIIKALFGN